MNKAAISYFYEARLAMILSGAYIGFMPDNYVQRHVEAGDLCALVPETKKYSLEICTITRKYGRAKRARGLLLKHWMITWRHDQIQCSNNMARPTGFEPLTTAFGGWRRYNAVISELDRPKSGSSNTDLDNSKYKNVYVLIF